MRVIFDGEAGAVEEALLSAQTRLRYYWCVQLARPVERGLGLEAWRGGRTRADLECNEVVQEALSQLPFPTNLVTEDGPDLPAGDAAFSFLIDPLDGTHNANAGYPMFSSSVAMYHGTRYVFGWVYDLSRDITYVASADRGAYLKTPLTCDRLTARRCERLEDAGIAMLRSRDGDRRALSQLLWSAGKVRISSCSSLDLCHAAAGVLDAFVDLSAHGHERSCDIAAAALILREAGGTTLHPDGTVREVLSPSRAAVEDFQPLLACGSTYIAQAIRRAIAQPIDEVISAS